MGGFFFPSLYCLFCRSVLRYGLGCGFPFVRLDSSLVRKVESCRGSRAIPPPGIETGSLGPRRDGCVRSTSA
ncbi:hypothetical protein B0H12DRAFT_121835 [Mycena haematopus]|nr:hypothetical protein B0H12DRAFT_121835 [Mycena haematopus]